MICLTNYARKMSGLPAYRPSGGLERSASSKAIDILRCDAFSHTACGRPFSWWIEKSYVNGQCWRAGENLAWGNGSLGGSHEIFKALVQSPHHRAAILSREYREIGIGFRGGELRRWPNANVWVQHFGRRC
jgi:uncharacterized protein YkwD